MMLRTSFLIAGALTAALIATAACGDDESTASTSTTTNSTSSGGGSSCADTCATLFACGMDGTPQNCPGYVAADEQTFLNGSMGDGCIANCEANPILAGIVNGDDCAGTVDQLKNLNPQFACTCNNGVTDPSCSGGGAGGTGSGGGGGAGGN